MLRSLTYVALFCCVFVWVGCGTTSYRRISHSYTEPPRLVLPNDLQTYAVVLVDGPTRTSLTESLPLDGLVQVVNDRDADLICRVMVDQPTHGQIQVRNKNKKTGVNPDSGQPYMPMWGAEWTNTASWSYELYDALRRQVFDGDGATVQGDFTSTQLSSQKSVALATGRREAAASLEETYNVAYSEATNRLRSDVGNGLVAQQRVISLNVAQSSEIEPRFSEAFGYLIRGDESSIRTAISIYESIGTNVINPENGKYAEHENYSGLYGKAAGYFMLQDWPRAMQWSRAAQNVRTDKNAKALYESAETMQYLTSRSL